MPNYPLNEPFCKDFIFDKEQQEQISAKLVELEPKMAQAQTYDSQHGAMTHDYRSCHNVPFRYTEFFDIAESLKEFTLDWYPQAADVPIWYTQFEFVRYLPPAQQFLKHQDDAPDGGNHDRLYTSVTMVDKSDDLEGGILRVWLPNSNIPIDVDLEPFETIVFPAWFWHEATPVFKGRRVIMISWGGRILPHARNNA
jgi:predicted 2-oxoglutarate/Fe(II)-dependent dioxygenase YbiX